MKTAEKLTDEANKKICSGEILQNLKPAAGKEFSDLPWEESEDMKEICDNFRIIERQRDLYRERSTAGPFLGPGGAAFHTRVYIIYPLSRKEWFHQKRLLH